ncbi:hypothetical protein GSVR_22190 [Geobacter sp. SVR]|nr:hypothetical protein GSVR_22190 [Geobacter sp. SVR]
MGIFRYEKEESATEEQHKTRTIAARNLRMEKHLFYKSYQKKQDEKASGQSVKTNFVKGNVHLKDLIIRRM